MTVAVTYPHIEKVPGEPARLARVPRVRVGMIVMDHLAYGWSPEEMCRQHPYLTPGEAYMAMSYYYDHQDEIEREIADEVEELKRARSQALPSRFLMRLRAEGRL